MAQKIDYYNVLGITRTASSEEIKDAYSKIVRMHSGKAETETQALLAPAKEAVKILSHEKKRAAYDRKYEKYFGSQSPRKSKSIFLPIAICVLLLAGAGLTVFLATRGPKAQKIDFRDNSFTSSQKEYIQKIADKAGNPERGKIEFLSYETNYVKDEDGKVKELVVVGLLRNGYASDTELKSLELTVKSADGETDIAYANFEGSYGTIKKGESIIWKFIFTEDFIYELDADLSKTVNYIEYTFERK